MPSRKWSKTANDTTVSYDEAIAANLRELGYGR